MKSHSTANPWSSSEYSEKKHSPKRESLPNMPDQLSPISNNDPAEVFDPLERHLKPFEMLRLKELLPCRAYRRVDSRPERLQATNAVKGFEDLLPNFRRDWCHSRSLRWGPRMAFVVSMLPVGDTRLDCLWEKDLCHSMLETDFVTDSLSQMWLMAPSTAPAVIAYFERPSRSLNRRYLLGRSIVLTQWPKYTILVSYTQIQTQFSLHH